MIGVYALCYKDSGWLSWNIQRMYDWVDEFSVCIGPVRKFLGSEPDVESVEAILALPDPDKKIHVISGVWDDKNQMTMRVVATLDADIIIQLDADEVWPRKTFDEAVGRLKGGARKLKAHMYTFWKTPETVMNCLDVTGWAAKALGIPSQVLEDIRSGQKAGQPALEAQFRKQDTGRMSASLAKQRQGITHLYFSTPGVLRAQLAGPWTTRLLDMHRAYRPCAQTKITHIPPDLAWANGETAYHRSGGTLRNPIWHFSYIGAERYARKAQFFAKRGDGDMPGRKYYESWDESHLDDEVIMTGQRRRFTKYGGPPIPEDVLAFVKEMA